MLLSISRPLRVGQNKLHAISELSNDVPYPPIFGIYIDNLEECLEVVRCDDPMLTGMVITLLIYFDNIVLLARFHEDLYKHLRILQHYYSRMVTILNANKTKVIVMKSKKNNYDHFIYDTNYLGKFPHTNI